MVLRRPITKWFMQFSVAVVMPYPNYIKNFPLLNASSRLISGGGNLFFPGLKPVGPLNVRPTLFLSQTSHHQFPLIAVFDELYLFQGFLLFSSEIKVIHTNKQKTLNNNNIELLQRFKLYVPHE